MRKVIVVDDEKLVRQGIVTTFPWNKHGFVIAGEAADGAKALELTEMLEPDLLVTDLTMPGMSGFELIREVRERRPDLPIVVLTCHDSFRNIQEALRLGVMDYIVKTEIVDEMVEDTLVRIAEQMDERAGARGRRPAVAAEPPRLAEGLLIAGRRPECSLMALQSAASVGVDVRALTEIDRQTWLLPAADSGEGARAAEALRRSLMPEGWALARITGIDARWSEEVGARLRRFRWREWFYADVNGEPLVTAAYGELNSRPRTVAEEPNGDAADPAEGWDEPGWVQDDDRFEELLFRMRRRGADPAEIRSIFYNVALEWDRLLGLNALARLAENADGYLFWCDWVRWIRRLRADIAARVSENASTGMKESVLKALEIIQSSEDLDMNEADVARMVNMSRGYFSTCFKKVTGQSFSEYLKTARLEKAKRLILGTDDSITLIAEKCGFRDYRYFSRVFREHAGQLPVEYRRMHGRK